MRWHAQVLHVARKDVRQARWLLLAYLVVVALATAEAAGLLALPLHGLMSGAVIVVGLGMLTMVVLVQGDAPCRSDAFWISLPLRRSSVMAAKLLAAAVLLVGVALIGQSIVLTSFDVSSRGMLTLLARSALFYGAWLAITGAIGALAPDLRTAVVAFITMVIVVALGSWITTVIAGPGRIGGTEPSSLVTAAVLAAGGLTVIAHQYFTRDRRRGLGISGGVIVALILVSGFVGTQQALATAAAPEVGEELRAAVRITGFSLSPGHRINGKHVAQVDFQLVGAAGDHRYVLHTSDARLEMGDGITSAAELGTQWVTLSLPAMPLRADLEWREKPFRPIPQPMTILLNEEQLDAVARGGVRVIIQGRVVVMEPRLVGVLPLVEGARVASHGTRLEVLDVDPDATDDLMQLRVSTVGRADQRPGEPDSWFHRGPAGDGRILYALVNDDRSEAVVIGPRGGWGTAVGGVLPGLSAWSMVWDLGFGRRSDGQPVERPSRDWVASAHLAVLEWTPVGGFPVRIGGKDGAAQTVEP